jgi:outer membrane cobalamin receptor
MLAIFTGPSRLTGLFLMHVLFLFLADFPASGKGRSVHKKSVPGRHSKIIVSMRRVVANGVLSGTISDETSEKLIGATVKIVGTNHGTTTDVEGNYSLQNIPPGVYDVAISYVGYESSIVPAVKIGGGETTTLNHVLKSGSTQLDDIVVIGNKALSGKVVETNELSMINDIKTSSLITTGISAQQIARSVDQDAGEVARRLPGVSVLNNFVNIRGMHERYNLTYLNGMIAPSSEADRRAFSYDMLPSNMIDKMIVYRSPAPELLADWAGGVIKIETKNTSIARQFEVNATTSYRPGSSFEDYYTYQGGSKDWMGKDDGTRALPSDFPAVGAIPGGGLLPFNISPADRDKAYSSEEKAANARYARELYNKWNLKKASSALDYRVGVNYYDSWNIGRMRLSNLTSISTAQTKLVRYQDFVPLEQLNGIVQEKVVYYKDTISQQTSRWSILQNLSLAISPKHTVQLKGFYNQLGTDETYVRDGYNVIGEFPGYTTRIIYTYKSRSLLGAQIAGAHTFGKDDSNNLQWGAAYNYSEEILPAQRALQFLPEVQGAPAEAPRYLSEKAVSFNIFNSLFYSTTKEENTVFSLDYEKKLKFGPSIKVGLFNENKTKPLESRVIRNANLAPDSLTRYRVDEAFASTVYTDNGSGAFIFDDDLASGQFDAKGKIYAGYAALNVPLFNNRLKIYGGMRYEGQDLVLNIPPSAYLAATGKKPELINRYLYYWLPSVNASFEFTKKLLLRAAYGKTLNRPNYRELIPLPVNDPRLENRRVGNDTLQDAQIQNLDLRLEFYPTDGEFISIGAFYKNLHNAIEPYVQTEGNNEIIYYDNTKTATVFGVEAEIRKSFSFLPGEWGSNLFTIVNLAWLQSEVEFPDGLLPDNSGNFDDNRTATRSLEGTASYVVNAGLYYDQPKWRTKVSVIYNVLGQRLVFAGTQLFPATYELPRHTIDLTLRQPVGKFLELRMGVQDLLNQPRKLYRDYDRDERYDPGKRNKLPQKDWLYQSYRPGSYFTVGLNLTL